MGYSFAPAASPIIGGLISQYFGWPSIFYFLGVIAVLVLFLATCFLHETCRWQVGNGSVPPNRWNRPLMDLIWPPNIPPDHDTCVPPKRRSTVLQTIKLAFRKQDLSLILFQATLFGGYIAIIIIIPFLFAQKFHFTILKIGAAHLFYALGGFTSRWTLHPLMDANIRRHSRLTGTNKQSEQGAH